MENPASEDATKMASVHDSTGVCDRGMCREKRRNDCPERDSALNSGGPEITPGEKASSLRAERSQPKVGANGRLRESDPPIIVSDGKADHTAKWRAEGMDGREPGPSGPSSPWAPALL